MRLLGRKVLIATFVGISATMLGTTAYLVGAHHSPPVAKGDGLAGIQWYSTLDSGLQAAEETGRPILFLSAAPHCAGVSGVW